MNYFIYIFFSLFTLSASAVDLEPLEDILKKDFSTKTHFITGIRCSALNLALNTASKEFPILINKYNPNEFPDTALFYWQVAITFVSKQSEYKEEEIGDLVTKYYETYLDRWKKIRDNGYFDEVSKKDAHYCEYMFDKMNKLDI